MILVIQNDPECPMGLLGGLLRDRAAQCGRPHRVIRAYAGETIPGNSDVRGGIVLGGQMSVADTGPYPFLIAVKDWIRRMVDADAPFLGICLGGQLLADVRGGRVTLKSERGEKGCREVSLTGPGRSDPLFAGMEETFPSFQWHNDAFDPPLDAVHLAESSACPFQAFRLGRAAYGVQFHPEVTPPIAADWSRKEPDADRYRRAFAGAEASYRAASLRFLSNFLSLADESRSAVRY